MVSGHLLLEKSIEKSSLRLKVNGVNLVKEQPSSEKQPQSDNILGNFAEVFYSFNSIHMKVKQSPIDLLSLRIVNI